MRPLLDERKENCGMREAVENGFPCEGHVITGLKAGVNEKELHHGKHGAVITTASNQRRQFGC